jgi:hypothetical protein
MLFAAAGPHDRTSIGRTPDPVLVGYEGISS